MSTVSLSIVKMAVEITAEINDGLELRVTNPDRVLYPSQGPPSSTSSTTTAGLRVSACPPGQSTSYSEAVA